MSKHPTEVPSRPCQHPEHRNARDNPHAKGHFPGSGHGHHHDCGHEHPHGAGREHGHGHGHGHGELRLASGRALRLALAVLGLFFLVELAGGVLTNSLALLSDAFHLLTDVAAVALALLAQWFARRPASALRSFGFRRVEILAALFNGLSLILVAVYIGHEAYQRLASPPEVRTWPMIIVASMGLVAQVITALVLGKAKGESLNVQGAYLHAMTDAVQSLGVVGAGLVMVYTGWFWVDPVVSVVIGLLIVYSAMGILWEATHVLIEGTPRELDLERIAGLMQETRGVSRVTDLHAWSLTSGYNALSAHVEAEPTGEDIGYEELRRRLTRSICETFAIHHVTLQIEKDCELCRSSGCGDWIEQRRGEEDHGTRTKS